MEVRAPIGCGLGVFKAETLKRERSHFNHWLHMSNCSKELLNTKIIKVEVIILKRVGGEKWNNNFQKKAGNDKYQSIKIRLIGRTK